jgi:hypothetical protein
MYIHVCTYKNSCSGNKQSYGWSDQLLDNCPTFSIGSSSLLQNLSLQKGSLQKGKKLEEKGGKKSKGFPQDLLACVLQRSSALKSQARPKPKKSLH